jgi:hypothetical protein
LKEEFFNVRVLRRKVGNNGSNLFGDHDKRRFWMNGK